MNGGDINEEVFCNNQIVSSLKDYNVAELKIFYCFIYYYKMQRDLMNDAGKMLTLSTDYLLQTLKKYRFTRSDINEIIKNMPNKLYIINQEGNKIGFISIFDSFFYNYENDEFEVVFSENIIELLDIEEKFSIMDLESIKKIKGKHAARLYELYCNYKNQKVYMMKRETFINYFQVPDSYNSSEIDRTILNKSIKEIEKELNIKITVEKIKRNNKITHYKFKFCQ